CVALGVLQISVVDFGVPRPPAVGLFLVSTVMYLPPSGADWQEDRVLDDIIRASGGRPATVAVVPNYNFFSMSNFRYESLRRRLPREVTRALTGPRRGIDFGVLKSRSQGPSSTAGKASRCSRTFAEGPYRGTTSTSKRE